MGIFRRLTQSQSRMPKVHFLVLFAILLSPKLVISELNMVFLSSVTVRRFSGKLTLFWFACRAECTLNMP